MRRDAVLASGLVASHGANLVRLGYSRKRGYMGRARGPVDQGFAERLKAAMEEARVRPTALARAMKAHATTVSRWRGGGIPEPRTLTALAAVLGVRPLWLKTGQGQRAAETPPTVPLGGVAALAGFLAGFPGDRLLIVRAVIQGLVTARQPIPAWLTDLHNQYLPVTLSAEDVAKIAAETEARLRGRRSDGDRRAG